MIQPILFKSAIYWLCLPIVRLIEGLIHLLAAGGLIADFPASLQKRRIVASFCAGAEGEELETNILWVLLRKCAN
jgi:hypothetical protein